MEELRSRFIFDIEIDLDDPIPLGDNPHGSRNIFYIKGGTFRGPSLIGKVLPGGGDWYLTRADGIGELNVRGLLQTDEGDWIYIHYHGYLSIPPEVNIRLNRGDPVDPSEYYFRMTPIFETSSEKLAWMNYTVAVGIGRLTPTGVAYRVFAIE
jgi:hypothetical protein